MNVYALARSHRDPYDGQVVIQLEDGSVAVNCLGMPVGAWAHTFWASPRSTSAQPRVCSPSEANRSPRGMVHG